MFSLLCLSGRSGIVIACIMHLSVRSSVHPFVCWSVNFTFSIARHRFDLESPIFTKHASWDTLSWYWKCGSLTLTFKIIWPFWFRIQGNLGYCHDNSCDNLQWIWARITKFTPDMLMGLSHLVLKMGVIDHGHQGHFGDFNSEFEEIWVVGTGTITCQRFGLNPGIPKFVPIMHLVYWSWPANRCYTSQRGHI